MNLQKGVRTIGSALFLLTLGTDRSRPMLYNHNTLLFPPGVYITYLVLVEDFRNHVLEDLYSIRPCSIPPIDTFTDVSFEYSIIANLLVVVACVGCTRWLLVPWLIVYFLNVLVLVGLAIFLFINPFPILHANMAHSLQFEMLRCLGFIPLILALLLAYCWVVVRYISFCWWRC